MRNLKKFENFSDDLNREHDGSFTKNDQNFDNLFSKDEEAQNYEESVDVLARFEEEFGDSEPSNQEIMEFYHKLRTEGIDGIEIFDTLLSNNKIGEGDDENYSDDDDINESVMDNIKSYVKKGVLTATILTTLLGNSAYGQTQKDEITKSLKTEIVQPGPMEEFLNKYVGDDYFIAKGSNKYDLETANTEARLEGQSKGFKSSSIVDQKAFKKDGEIVYIIIYKK